MHSFNMVLLNSVWSRSVPYKSILETDYGLPTQPQLAEKAHQLSLIYLAKSFCVAYKLSCEQQNCSVR